MSEARGLFKIALTHQDLYGFPGSPPLPCPTCHGPERPWPAYKGTDGIKAELGHFKRGDAVQETKACRLSSYSSDPGPGTVLDIGERMVLVSLPTRGAYWYTPSNLEHVKP